MNSKIEFERVHLEDLKKSFYEPGPILSLALEILTKLQAMLPEQTAARIIPDPIQEMLLSKGWDRPDNHTGLKDTFIGKEDILAEFCIFSASGIACVFHPPTSTLFRTNKYTAQLLNDARCGVPIGEIGQRYGISEDDLKALFAKIPNTFETRTPVQPSPSGRILEKLVLNVSNDCNMRCRYCYANGGNYGLPRRLMTPDTARKALERAFAQFSRIETISFFGGEPTLNPSAIEAACEVVTRRFKQNRLAHPPKLGLVTNGFSLDARMQAIIQKYHLKVTFSLDGMQNIHDQLRVTPDGQGTFEHVAKTIGQLQKLTGGREPSLIETTYTRLHKQAHITLSDLTEFYRQQYGIYNVHIPVVSSNEQDDFYWAVDRADCAMVSEDVARLLGTWLSDQPQSLFSINKCLETLVVHRQTRGFCGAGITEITVMTNGDVFPCYRFLEPEFYIGNVFEDSLFKDGKYKEVQFYFLGHAKAHKIQCKQCWARNLCQVCMRTIQLQDERLEYIPVSICDLNQAIAKTVLLTLARLQSYPEQWDQFGKTLSRIAHRNAR
jgi:uncharacterized protein